MKIGDIVRFVDEGVIVYNNGDGTYDIMIDHGYDLKYVPGDQLEVIIEDGDLCAFSDDSKMWTIAQYTKDREDAWKHCEPLAGMTTEEIKERYFK
jgi:hypothetical protein